jgi:hypothetical protein
MQRHWKKRIPEGMHDAILSTNLASKEDKAKSVNTHYTLAHEGFHVS